MLIVGIDTLYASSGSALNAALTPDMLDAGSIGIYTVDPTTGLFKLVTKTTTGTGLIPSTSVKGANTLKICQGLGGGDFYASEKHQVSQLKFISGAKYRLGTGETIYVGYNSVTGVGDINFDPQAALPEPPYGLLANIYRREAAIKLRARYRGNNSYGPSIYAEVVIQQADTRLSMLNNIAAFLNAYQEDGIAGFPFTASVIGSGVLPNPVQTAATTATTGGTLAAGTYYYKIVALNANGQSLGSNEVSITTTGSTSTNTLNWVVVPGATSYRVYRGTSSGNQTVYYTVGSGATVTLADTNATSTAGTIVTTSQLGVKIVVTDITATYEGSVFGGLENAPVTKVGVVVSSGTPAQLQAIEFDSNIYRGDLYTMSTLEKKLPKTVDITKTYDTYKIQSVEITDDKTGARALSDTLVNSIIAFVVQANVVDTNQQANFEAIMTDIFPATAQISA